MDDSKGKRDGRSHVSVKERVVPELKMALGKAGEALGEGLILIEDGVHARAAALEEKVERDLRDVRVDVGAAREAATRAEGTVGAAAKSAGLADKSAAAAASSALGAAEQVDRVTREAGKARAHARDAAGDAARAQGAAVDATRQVTRLAAELDAARATDESGREVKGADAFAVMSRAVANIGSVVQTAVANTVSCEVEVVGADGEKVKKTLTGADLVAYVLAELTTTKDAVGGALGRVSGLERSVADLGELVTVLYDALAARGVVPGAQPSAQEPIQVSGESVRGESS